MMFEPRDCRFLTFEYGEGHSAQTIRIKSRPAAEATFRWACSQLLNEISLPGGGAGNLMSIYLLYPTDYSATDLQRIILH
jgi:hypothetical protein